MSDNDFFEKVGTNKIAPPNNSVSNIMEKSSSDPKKPPQQSGEIHVRRWAQADTTFWQASETCETLAPGFYRFGQSEVGPNLIRMDIAIDNLIELPDTASADILAEFQLFWTLGDRFLSRGFLHKRGIMLYGPPGSGKTCCLMLMAAEIIRQGGIVCRADNPYAATNCLALLRRIEPHRPVVVLLEDLDALVAEYNENAFLALLDGETQVNRIVYVATTNYPERLDSRFVDRPSRFDTIRYIGMPSAAARRIYLSAKEPELEADGDLDHWVRRTDGFSIAHLRELIILVKCLGQPLNQAISRLENMRVNKPNSEKLPGRPAFGIASAKDG